MDAREFFAILFRHVILILAGAHVALAGTRDPNTPDEKYVEFGKQFPSVLRIRANIIDPESKYPYQYGSAVAIRPHWILTAAHVLAGAENPVAIKDGDKKFALGPVFVHKDFEEETVGFHDIALLYSPEDFELKFYTPLYTDKDEVGKAVTIAGYGFYGTFHTGGKQIDSNKRAGHNKIDSAERAVLLCSPSVTNRMPLEFMIASGDSGGGLFIGNELAGINSFLMATDKKPDGSYGDDAAFTRVSLYADWVESQIAAYELKIAGKGTLAADLDLISPPEE
jgi:hypothetical protein